MPAPRLIVTITSDQAVVDGIVALVFDAATPQTSAYITSDPAQITGVVSSVTGKTAADLASVAIDSLNLLTQAKATESITHPPVAGE